MYKNGIKRILDITLTLPALIVLAPALIAVAILVRIKLGAPVIFKQKRPGKDEKVFMLYKFRTMTNERDEKGNLLPDDVRLTSFGQFLRSTSLDELPELFNILRGDMAIIGPRPQLVRDMVFMSQDVRKRHSVRPGLSGLAQINGRNDISWEAKFQYDLQYIENITLVNDMKIMFKTVTKVFAREDVQTQGMATAEDYGDYLLRVGKVDCDTYCMKQDEAKQLL
ncbi:MAG TPA: UDP-galactose phosphate transferase [Clostridiales bacterium]|jgi:lipopolysaccharide/colanic/teichoic acid biosynthesis glycosyltransferase|nr:UDP-galactose phosphate transferase [Clostridiales bacterium]